MSLRRAGIALLAAGLATAFITVPAGTAAKAQLPDRSPVDRQEHGGRLGGGCLGGGEGQADRPSTRCAAPSPTRTSTS